MTSQTSNNDLAVAPILPRKPISPKRSSIIHRLSLSSVKEEGRETTSDNPSLTTSRINTTAIERAKEQHTNEPSQRIKEELESTRAEIRRIDANLEILLDDIEAMRYMSMLF